MMVCLHVLYVCSVGLAVSLTVSVSPSAYVSVSVYVSGSVYGCICMHLGDGVCLLRCV